MFYSHEILTNRQYGVVTVWLAANAGPRSSTSKRLSRKAILEVDVTKACTTIIHPPGAPLALRTQANLLYGVTRVYQEQYRLALHDVEKLQENLRRAQSIWGSSAIDRNAGKARRGQLILPDDPDFNLNPELPAFDFDAAAGFFLPSTSQVSARTSSQLSPLQIGSASTNSSLLGGLQIPGSSGRSSFDLPLPFGRDSTSAQKQPAMMMNLQDEEDLLMGEFGLTIDANGNILPEPELPPHPAQQAHNNGEPGLMQLDEDAPILIGTDGDIQPKLGEAPLPDAEAFPARQQAGAEEQMGLDQVAAEPTQARKTKQSRVMASDSETQVSMSEIRRWKEDYLTNVEDVRKHRASVTPAQARHNAYNMIFGRGIAGVGQPCGIPGAIHPLAEDFAGNALYTRLLGHIIPPEPNTLHGKRRSSNQAFGEEEELEGGRRVRPRLEGGEEAHGGFDGQEELSMLPGDERDIELGRALLSDPSNWPSMPHFQSEGMGVAESSIQGSAKPPAEAAPLVDFSPLVGRSSVLHNIERYSDSVQQAPGTGEIQPGPVHDSSSAQLGGEHSAGIQSQGSEHGLERFLSFVERQALLLGELREDDDQGHSWIHFDHAFEEGHHMTKANASSIFMNILSLSTKGLLALKQESPNNQPFGQIRIGVKLPAKRSKSGETGGVENDGQ